MKKFFSNSLLLFLIALAISIGSLIFSFMTNQWHWFGRSGSWLTIIGVLMSSRPLIRLGLKDWIISQQTIDLGHITPTPEEILEETEHKLDALAFKLGIIISITGTLVWAYGDLLGK